MRQSGIARAPHVPLISTRKFVKMMKNPPPARPVKPIDQFNQPKNQPKKSVPIKINDSKPDEEGVKIVEISMNSNFHQRQRANSCRIHTINNLLSSNVVDESEFKHYCDSFGKEFNCSDIMQSGFSCWNLFGENEVLYLLRKKFGMISFTIPANQKHNVVSKLSLDIDKIESDKAIVWNRSHMYAMKKSKGIWYNHDSNFARPRIQKINYNYNVAFIYSDPSSTKPIRQALDDLVTTETALKEDVFKLILFRKYHQALALIEHRKYDTLVQKFLNDPREFDKFDKSYFKILFNIKPNHRPRFHKFNNKY